MSSPLIAQAYQQLSSLQKRQLAEELQVVDTLLRSENNLYQEMYCQQLDIPSSAEQNIHIACRIAETLATASRHLPFFDYLWGEHRSPRPIYNHLRFVGAAFLGQALLFDEETDREALIQLLPDCNVIAFDTKQEINAEVRFQNAAQSLDEDDTTTVLSSLQKLLTTVAHQTERMYQQVPDLLVDTKDKLESVETIAAYFTQINCLLILALYPQRYVINMSDQAAQVDKMLGHFYSMSDLTMLLLYIARCDPKTRQTLLALLPDPAVF